MGAMDTEIPRLPDPASIQREIQRLRSRIGELRALLPLAEQQHLHRITPIDSLNDTDREENDDGQ